MESRWQVPNLSLMWSCVPELEALGDFLCKSYLQD